MSYKIIYGTSRFDKKKRGKKTAVMILCGMLLIALFIAPVREAAAELLLGTGSASARNAYSVFEAYLEQGSGFGEAVTAFCASIIENAEQVNEK